jgi:hypothetical protein
MYDANNQLDIKAKCSDLLRASSLLPGRNPDYMKVLVKHLFKCILINIAFQNTMHIHGG